MKVYLWDNVLSDRTSGFCVVVARDAEEALRFAKEEVSPEYYEALRHAGFVFVDPPCIFRCAGGD